LSLHAALPISTDPGETLVTGDGARLGLPEGRSAELIAVGGPAQGNNYPAEQLTFSRRNPVTGDVQTHTIGTSSNASAAQTAELLSRVAGVSANAFTSATLTDLNIEDFSSPLQITINGEELLEYEGGVLSSDVPDPQVD